MKKSLTGLAEQVGQEVVVRVERGRLTKDHLGGFLVGVGERLLLLHVVDGNTLLLNGYTALRLRDVTGWHADDTFVPRALRLLDRRPVVPEAVDLTDWPSLLASAQRHSPLLWIEMEKAVPDRAFVGRLAKMTAREVVLQEVSREGRWEAEDGRYALADITWVGFGDGYTQTLASLVAHEAPTGQDHSP